MGLLVLQISGEAAPSGSFHEFLFASLPLGLFGSEWALPSPRPPQVPALQEEGAYNTFSVRGKGDSSPILFCQAAQAPEVTYEADKGSMWTLLLTNLGRCLRLARPPSPPMSQGAGGRAR